MNINTYLNTHNLNMSQNCEYLSNKFTFVKGLPSESASDTDIYIYEYSGYFFILKLYITEFSNEFFIEKDFYVATQTFLLNYMSRNFVLNICSNENISFFSVNPIFI